MTKKSSSIAEYILWLLQQYNENRKRISPPTLYRLVEIKEKKDNQYELYFQIIGKAAIFKTTPSEVLKNKESIESFSSNDISIINQLAYKNLSQPKNKILGKTFSEKLNTLIFKVALVSDSSISEKTASVLSRDNDFIRNLSPQDAHVIGYAAAQEENEKEKTIISAIRENKKKIKVRAIKNIFFNKKASALLKIQHEDNGSKSEFSGVELLQDKETLNSLTPIDAAVVGYFAAQEEYIMEKDLINQLRKSNSSSD